MEVKKIFGADRSLEGSAVSTAGHSIPSLADACPKDEQC